MPAGRPGQRPAAGGLAPVRTCRRGPAEGGDGSGFDKVGNAGSGLKTDPTLPVGEAGGVGSSDL